MVVKNRITQYHLQLFRNAPGGRCQDSCETWLSPITKCPSPLEASYPPTPSQLSFMRLRGRGDKLST